MVVEKSMNNRAWFFMIPALLLLGFVALIPLIMVMNYSFHDIITLKSKIWVGFEWYREVLHASRFWESLGRSLLFSTIILIIEIHSYFCSHVITKQKILFLLPLF